MDFCFLMKQVSKFGVHFDYKYDCRRAWLYFIIPTFLTLALLILEIFIRNESFWLALHHFGCNIHFTVWISVVISFTIFIRCLSERFAVLNALLRFLFLIVSMHASNWISQRSLSPSLLFVVGIDFWMEMLQKCRSTITGKNRMMWLSSLGVSMPFWLI